MQTKGGTLYVILNKTIMKILYFTFLCFISITSYSQNTHTPEKGSIERKEILDIFRADFSTEKNQILFQI